MCIKNNILKNGLYIKNHMSIYKYENCRASGHSTIILELFFLILFSGRNMFLDYFALGVLIFVFLVIFYGIIILHDIPYLIAKNAIILMPMLFMSRGG